MSIQLEKILKATSEVPRHIIQKGRFLNSGVQESQFFEFGKLRSTFENSKKHSEKHDGIGVWFFILESFFNSQKLMAHAQNRSLKTHFYKLNYLTKFEIPFKSRHQNLFQTADNECDECREGWTNSSRKFKKVNLNFKPKGRFHKYFSRRNFNIII